ncbi:MAG: hypothetical protein COC19_02645 [SAR86 cluster bacterium]|uniref:HTH cro/C1-type domain-containing protein n=1 Tax=SAR86 cluster bacterium TaxID=2030880 RepID=A0A2A4MR45_9GAMM|nr:MAG: hypothetical protein COC19_02645 [SAR86 cluster bacterium]
MKESIQVGFAKRFKQALDEAGYARLQLRQLGKLFGVTSQAVTKWLNAEAMPRSSRASEVAGALGVRRVWLMDGELPMRSIKLNVGDQPENSTRGKELSISSVEYKVLRDFRNLPKKLQDSFASNLDATTKALDSKGK